MNWRAFVHPRNRRGEIDEELAAHLQMATADRIDRGDDPERARLAATRELGNLQRIREDTRAIWTWTWLEHLWQDLGFGARILTTAPALSATAVILIALVIGGNTTVYSMVHGLLTKPARGVTADRLVVVGVVGRPGANNLSYPDYHDVKLARSFAALIAFGFERLTLGHDLGTYASLGLTVTHDYFQTLGVSLVRGRGFTGNGTGGAAGLEAIVSYRIWQEHFRGADDVLGRSITLNGLPASIVGVAPAGFRGAMMMDRAEVWLPIEPYYRARGLEDQLTDRRNAPFLFIARLAAGVLLREAESEASTISRRLETDYPRTHKGKIFMLAPYSTSATSVFAEGSTLFLAIFSIITAITLVVVSANVANLMLARAVVRQRETAVRQSLGASNGRILTMAVAEGLTIALTAWLAACIVALTVSKAVVRLIPPSREGIRIEPDFTPDWQVAGYAMLLALLATLAFTVAPALATWRRDVLPTLKTGEPVMARGRSRVSSVLVILQLAFSVLLLTASGLAYRAGALVGAIDVGFDQAKMLLVTIQVGESTSTKSANAALLERLRGRLAALPGVEAVSYVRHLPIPFSPAEYPLQRDGSEEPFFGRRIVAGPEYLRTLGLTPVSGRDVMDRDRRLSGRTAIVNMHLAADLWPGQSAVGQRLRVGREGQVVEVAGVAPNALFEGFRTEDRTYYVILPEQQDAGTSVQPTFYLRHTATLDIIAPAVGAAIKDVDPRLPLVTMQSMTEALEGTRDSLGLVSTLLGVFSGVSLLIAAIGQYAAIAFDTRRRTRELGIRIALGASRRQILGGVLKDGLRWTSLGLVVGFALSAAIGGTLRSVLLGVSPTDPGTFAGVFVLLAGASLLACYLPARRAAAVNPVDALRQE